MIVHASAPVRLDFAGGWTDVAPFATESRGVVVNAAIELRAHVEVELGGSTWRLDSRDLGRSLELQSADPTPHGLDLPLLRAAIRGSGIGPCRVTTRSEAPPGSGLGSSGALDVALVAALDRALGRPQDRVRWAEKGWELETLEAGLPGGKQDQYAAAMGGWHRFTFERGMVGIEPITLSDDVRAELARRIVVCYTGQSRVSSHTIARVMDAYSRGDPAVRGALEELVRVAEQMAAALRRADWAGIGELLSHNWRLQQQLDQGMRTDPMAALERAMNAAGSLGGKAAGAGAGGAMIFLTDGDRERSSSAARVAGAQVLPVEWATEGVRVW